MQNRKIRLTMGIAAQNDEEENNFNQLLAPLRLNLKLFLSTNGLWLDARTL